MSRHQVKVGKASFRVGPGRRSCAAASGLNRFNGNYLDSCERSRAQFATNREASARVVESLSRAARGHGILDQIGCRARSGIKAKFGRQEGRSTMPDKRTIKRALKDKHGARSPQQAIAIGLSKARRAGVKLTPPKKGKAKESTRKSARYAYQAGQHKRKTHRRPRVSLPAARCEQPDPVDAEYDRR